MSDAGLSDARSAPVCSAGQRPMSCGKLWLFTFARDQGACAFYERSGFRVAVDGSLDPPALF